MSAILSVQVSVHGADKQNFPFPLLPVSPEATSQDASEKCEGIFAPFKTIPRLQNKRDVQLYAGKKYLAATEMGGDWTIRLFDENWGEHELKHTAHRILVPAIRVRQAKGLFFTARSVRLPIPDEAWAIYNVDREARLQKVISFDSEEVNSAIPLSGAQHAHGGVLFFDWGNGFGSLRFQEVSYGKNNVVQKSWITHYDSNFHAVDTCSVPDGYSWTAFAAGPGKKIACVQRDNAFTFFRPDGKSATIPIAPKTGNTVIPPPAEYSGWNRPGIVPGSRYFVMAHADRGTLPIFDLGEWPPSLIHTLSFRVPPWQNLATLVSGNRLYVKLTEQNYVECWDLTDKVTRIWQKFYTAMDNGGQLFLGHYKGNVIIPGRANIFFLDEKTGAVNYRFCTIDSPGTDAYPDLEWIRNAKAAGKYREVISYAIFHDYLIASTKVERVPHYPQPKTDAEPLFVWKLPEKLLQK